jgi:bacterioferritin (cytochrome b1)
MEKLIRKVTPENILLDKTTYENVGKVLREFGIVEMKHAADIMERIYYLGGEATTKAPKPVIGETLNDFAINGVKAEEEALTLYRTIIGEARRIGDLATQQLFRKIYDDEEKHLFKFQEYVNIKPEPELQNTETAEWQNIFTDDYYEMLNKAVALEISAIIQYTNQHEKASLLAQREKSLALEVITESNKSKVVSDLLKKIFMAEMDHLEKISERLYLIEGEAVSVPDPFPQVGNTVDDFLRLDHKAENDAILLYRDIIEEAIKRKDTTTRRIFEDIVLQEEEHFWTLDDYLK